MPTYSYGCKDCGHAFDIHQSFSDESLTVCPECLGTLRKKFNSVGVVFKGSGFYRTDSRSSSDSSVTASASSADGQGNKESKESKESKVPSSTGSASTTSANATSSSATGRSSKNGNSSGSKSTGESSAKSKKKAPANVGS